MNRREFFAAVAAPLIAPASWLPELIGPFRRNGKSEMSAGVAEWFLRSAVEMDSTNGLRAYDSSGVLRVAIHPRLEAEIFATAWLTPEDLL